MNNLNLKNLLNARISNRLLDILMVLLLLLVPVLVYYTGGTKNVFVHLMYIPIIISARKLNALYVVAISILAGFLVGPIMPEDVVLGQMQPVNNWLLRLMMYLFVGIIIYLINRKSRRELFATQIVLSSVNEGICVIDDLQRIAFVNQVFADIHNISKNDLIGESVIAFLRRNYKEVRHTKGYNQLVYAIKSQTNEDKLMVPKQMDNYGEVITEYAVKSIRKNGVDGSVIIIRNIQNQINYERNLLKLLYTDSLTGCHNRRCYEKKLAELDTEHYPLGFILFDVDGIKFINDSFGHQKGDEVIIKLAYILNSAIKNNGFVARLDGDEFVGVIHNATHKLLESITERVNREITNFEVNSLQIGVSSGYSICTDANYIYKTFEEAENNMYLDKNSSDNSMRNNPIDTIINTLHEKDEYSEQHSKSVSEISANIAKALNLPRNQIKEISHAALLHDIGKIIVPIDILTKTGPLDDMEYAKMKEHSSIGYRLLANMKNLNEIPELVLHHHERWDGTGYPNQIKKEEIPLGARIISVADSFNAMTTDRTYRKKLSNEEALSEIIRCKGTQFDPEIIDVFESKFEYIV